MTTLRTWFCETSGGSKNWSDKQGCHVPMRGTPCGEKDPADGISVKKEMDISEINTACRMKQMIRHGLR